MAPGKKNAARLGAYIVFVDESGFLLIPSVRKTWAPRGHTPLCRHRYNHDRLSVISGLSVSPTRRQLGLYFHLHETNLRHPEVCAFLRDLLRQIRRPLVVIWDKAPIHRGASIRELCQRFPRLHLEALPAYAPELNPDEYVWAQAKTTLANARPDDLTDLYLHLLDTLCDLAVSPNALRACLNQSELSLFA